MQPYGLPPHAQAFPPQQQPQQGLPDGFYAGAPGQHNYQHQPLQQPAQPQQHAVPAGGIHIPLPTANGTPPSRGSPVPHDGPGLGPGRVGPGFGGRGRGARIGGSRRRSSSNESSSDGSAFGSSAASSEGRRSTRSGGSGSGSGNDGQSEASRAAMAAAISAWRASTPCAVLQCPSELASAAIDAVTSAFGNGWLQGGSEALAQWISDYDAPAAKQWNTQPGGPPRSCRLVLMGVHHELTAFDVRLLLLALCPNACVAQIRPDFQRDRASGAVRRGADGQPRRSGLWRVWLGSEEQARQAVVALQGSVYTDVGRLVYVALPSGSTGREACVRSLAELQRMLLAWRSAALGGTGRPASLVRVEFEVTGDRV